MKRAEHRRVGAHRGQQSVAQHLSHERARIVADLTGGGRARGLRLEGFARGLRSGHAVLVHGGAVPRLDDLAAGCFVGPAACGGVGRVRPSRLGEQVGLHHGQ